jgi:adenine/guanine phosphoribosyltransferase-like PRPP-binding protein
VTRDAPGTLRVPLQGAYRPRLLSAEQAATAPSADPAGPWTDARAAPLPDGRWVELPFLALPPDFETAIAYLAINQAPFAMEDALSAAMAAEVAHLGGEVVVGMPTFGMVLAAPVARHLGHPDYVPLGYSRKFWYQDELSEPVTSITSPGQPKQVFLDPRLLERLAGRRVLLVEDVISTGGTLQGELRLMERIGADVVGIVTAVQETNAWTRTLTALHPSYPGLVHAPLRFPLFTRDGDDRWVAVPGTAPPD